MLGLGFLDDYATAATKASGPVVRGLRRLRGATLFLSRGLALGAGRLLGFFLGSAALLPLLPFALLGAALFLLGALLGLDLCLLLLNLCRLGFGSLGTQ